MFSLTLEDIKQGLAKDKESLMSLPSQEIKLLELEERKCETYSDVWKLQFKSKNSEKAISFMETLNCGLTRGTSLGHGSELVIEARI